MANEEGRSGLSAAWGIAAGVSVACAIATWQVAIAPKSTFPIWPAYLFGGLTLATVYMCFATIRGWRLTGRSRRPAGGTRPPVTDEDADTAETEIAGAATTAGRSATAVPGSLSSPVNIRLIPELDNATNRFRLVTLNRGDLGHFRVRVVDAHSQDGNWIGPRSWPVPWLEDGSIDAEQVAKFDGPKLDFAHFDFLGLQEDLEGTKWLKGNHWVFPSLPQPVKARYSAVRYWSELNNQHFTITVRVIREDPPGYAETQFKIGNDGAEPYCRELPERPASGPAMPKDPKQLRDLAVYGQVQEPTVEEPEPESEPTATPAITDRWYHTSDGGKVPSLMRLTHTGLFHPAYGIRQQQETPPSVKIGMLMACQPIDPAGSGTELRAKFLAFLSSPSVMSLIAELTHVGPGMSWQNLAGHGPRTLEAALTASAEPLDGVPAASALFLPPTAGEELYGRDGHTATLILYVEPRTADAEVAPPSDLATWSHRFTQALAVPGAFADFLDTDVGLATSNDPPAQLGVWLQSREPLTVMVDISGLRMLPGSSPSNQFIGWTFAGDSGKSATGVARDLIIQLCEYELHLDDFEKALPPESP